MLTLSLAITSASAVEEIFKEITFTYLASRVETAPALVIGLAANQATFEAFRLFFTRHAPVLVRFKSDLMGRERKVIRLFYSFACVYFSSIIPRMTLVASQQVNSALKTWTKPAKPSQLFGTLSDLNTVKPN